MPKRDPASYLAAMIDGEGSVSADHRRRSVSIHNTDMRIIETVLECCAALGIRTHLYKELRPRYRTLYRVAIFGRDQLRKIARLPLASEEKCARLDAALDSYRQTQRRPEEFPLQEVREYAALGLNGVEIAAALDVHNSTAYR